MRTFTTYNGTEAITWRNGPGGVKVKVSVERDRYALPPGSEIGSDCPRCGALDGRPCKSVGGNTLTKPHKARGSFVAKPPQCENCSNPAASFNARYCKECRVKRDRLLWRMRERSLRRSCIDCGAEIWRKSTRCKPCSLAVVNAERSAS